MNSIHCAASFLGGVLLLSTSLAQAETMASRSAFGGTSQTQAVCSITNTGQQALSVSVMQIRDESGAIRPIAGNSCGTTLALNKTCALTVQVSNTKRYFCRVAVGPSKANARGSLEIHSSQAVLNSVPLE